MINILELNKNNFKFKHSLGQNFIFDQNLLQAIVNDAGINSSTCVLEIGTGSGTLTQILANHAKKVVTVEIDKDLKPLLQDSFKNHDNIELVFGDIMKQNISELESKLEQDYTIVANLPYYITTPIIFKFLENSTKLKKMVIMVQKEVAQRLISKPNTKDYGLLTVSVNAICNVKISRIVKRNMFIPSPNVDSAEVVLDIVKDKHNITNPDLFAKVTKAAFAMRRKTLTNNLKTSFGLSQQAIENLFLTLSLPLNIRGETLSIENFVSLTNELNKII